MEKVIGNWAACTEENFSTLASLGKEPLCKTYSRRSKLFQINHFFATFWEGFRWETVKSKKFRSNRLEFQLSFIVKLLFITVLQSRGPCFREQSKFFKSGNLFVIYPDELSIYKWTGPWNIKGRFPESWGLRASVSSSPLSLPLPFFFAPAPTFALYNTSTGNACYAG